MSHHPELPMEPGSPVAVVAQGGVPQRVPSCAASAVPSPARRVDTLITTAEGSEDEGGPEPEGRIPAHLSRRGSLVLRDKFKSMMKSMPSVDMHDFEEALDLLRQEEEEEEEEEEEGAAGPVVAAAASTPPGSPARPGVAAATCASEASGEADLQLSGFVRCGSTGSNGSTISNTTDGEERPSGRASESPRPQPRLLHPKVRARNSSNSIKPGRPQASGKMPRNSQADIMLTMQHVRHSERALSTARIVWSSTPKNVFVLMKPRDDEVSRCYTELLTYLLVEQPQLRVYVQPSAIDEAGLREAPEFRDLLPRLRSWQDEEQMRLAFRAIVFDFVLSLGGDGTLLFLSSLFQKIVPPVMSFGLGSLGFLTPFTFGDYKTSVPKLIAGDYTLTLRMRLRCEVTGGRPMHGEPEPTGVFHVLNEIVIDRGPSPYLSDLDVFCDQSFLTCVQGDGLIVGTPTGSTAYSLAAGGSMVHPHVPAMLLTPICPHSLSFRPVVLPSTVEILVKVPTTARNPVAISMDGRNRQLLSVGGTLRITASVCPMPTVNKASQHDWFNSLVDCLHWNERARQKASSKGKAKAV